MHDATVAVLGEVKAPQKHARPRRFYVGMALVTIGIVIVGFGPAMVHTSSRKGPLNGLVGFHAAVFTLWLLLFLAQSLLVGRGRLALHRNLGFAGVALAIVMVVSGYFTAIAMARRGFDLSGDLNAAADPLGLLVFQLGDLLTFSILFTLAVIYRRRPEVHKRLMVLAVVGGLMAAPLTHFLSHIPLARANPPMILIPLTMLYFAHAVYDKIARGRIHPLSLWVAVGLFTWSNLRAAIINPHPLWRQFAAWLAG